jgi:hypothetical protein
MFPGNLRRRVLGPTAEAPNLAMDDLIGGAEIDLECGCGALMKATLGELRHSPTLTSPNSHEIKGDRSQLDREMRPVDRALRNLDQSIRRIGK